MNKNKNIMTLTASSSVAQSFQRLVWLCVLSLRTIERKARMNVTTCDT